jgi:hypothetical protein
MAIQLTDEQQKQVELQTTIMVKQLEIDKELRQQDADIKAADQRAEAIRIATSTLIENKRSLPVSERGITAEEITAYADTIVNYIKG